MACIAKRAHFTCLGTPNGLGSFLEKHIFDPFLTHFLPQNSPVQGILEFKEGQNGQPRAQNAPKTLVLAFHVVQDHF